MREFKCKKVSEDKDRMFVGPTSLRDRLKQVPEYKNCFSDAASLWESLFVKKRDQFPIAGALKAFIERNYCGGIENSLNEIIYGSVEGTTILDKSFIPTPRESLLLLSAAWLQNLGMMWGLFDSELDSEQLPLPKSDKELSKLVEEYTARTKSYLITRWSSWCDSWAPDDKALLARLCEAQKPQFDLSLLDTSADTHKGMDRPNSGVSLRKLAALIRLSNVCSLKTNFCPLEIKKQIIPKTFNGPDYAYLGVTKLVQEVVINHRKNVLSIEVQLPTSVELLEDSAGEFNFPLTLDVRPDLAFFRNQIQSVLNNISPFLRGCPNTEIDQVELLSSRENGSAELSLIDLIPNLWAMHLATLTCATESVCCFAFILYQMLQKEIEGSNNSVISIQERITNKCRIAKKLQPLNIMTLRLASEINQKIKLWRSDQNPTHDQLSELQKEIREYLETRKSECKKVGIFAKTDIEKFDVLIVYGFSRNILTTLEEKNIIGNVLAVPINSNNRSPECQCDDEDSGDELFANESSRLLTWCEKRSINCELVPIDRLDLKIRRLITQGRKIAFLIGTRSVLMDRNERGELIPERCYSTPGNRGIAQAVCRAGGKAIVIAESGKKASAKEAILLREAFERSEKDPNIHEYERVDELIVGQDVNKVIIPES